MAVTPALLAIPPAPFAPGGQGEYKSDRALKDDTDLARKVLSDPRWPITAALRARIVEWLEIVMETTDDERARVNAIKSLVAADKLNLEEAKLRLAAEKQSKPQEVNVNVSGGVAHVFSRLDELEALYANAHAPAKGNSPGNGAGEPVHPGGGQSGPVAKP